VLDLQQLLAQTRIASQSLHVLEFEFLLKLLELLDLPGQGRILKLSKL